MVNQDSNPTPELNLFDLSLIFSCLPSSPDFYFHHNIFLIILRFHFSKCIFRISTLLILFFSFSQRKTSFFFSSSESQLEIWGIKEKKNMKNESMLFFVEVEFSRSNNTICLYEKNGKSKKVVMVWYIVYYKIDDQVLFKKRLD